jgi:hypothetical protein
MSQEVDSYREALEEEIKKWSGYERALRLIDRQAFQELMDMARSYAAEASCAQSKIVFEPMAMSIILALDNCMKQIEQELSQLKPPKKEAAPEAPLKKPIEAPTAPQPKPAVKKPQRGLLDFG